MPPPPPPPPDSLLPTALISNDRLSVANRKTIFLLVVESDNECDSCSPQATCKKGSCICLFPLVGDGQSCSLRK